MNVPIVKSEVHFFRKRLKTGVGTIGFNNNDIKYLLGDNIDDLLSVSYSLYFNGGYYPLLWCISPAFPHFKGGKLRKKYNPSDYRCLQKDQSAAKLFCMICAYRIMWYYIQNGILHEIQYGGLINHSTITQIIRVVETLNEKINECDFDSKMRMITVNRVLFWTADIEKAFDSTSRLHVLKSLVDDGVSGKLLNFVGCFLARRFQKVIINESQSNKLRTYNGVPQGNSLSSILFLVNMNSILNYLPIPDHYSLFIDDLSGMSIAKTWTKAIDIVNSVFRNLIDWGNKSAQVFHPNKFDLLVMRPKTKSLTGQKIIHQTCSKKVINNQISFNDKILNNSLSTMFLGYLIDNKLRMDLHIKYLVGKVKSSLWRILKHKNTRSVVSACKLDTIFKTWILCQFSYGSPLFIHIIFPRISCIADPLKGYGKVWGELEKLYFSSARTILGMHTKTPGIVCCVILGWLPLHLYLIYLSMCWFYKIRNSKDATNKLLFRLYDDDEKWQQTLFFKGSYEAVKFFENFYRKMGNTTKNFLEMDIMLFRSTLLKAVWLFVGSFWNDTDLFKHSKKYLCTWEQTKLKIYSTSRFTEKFMFRLFAHQNDLNSFRYRRKIGNIKSPLCRHCGQHEETVDHILWNCKVKSLILMFPDNNIEANKLLLNRDLLEKFCNWFLM